MSITEYAGFMGITVAAILIILRACYFLFVLKSDPIKAVVTVRLNWMAQHREDAEQNAIIQSLS